MMRRKIMKKTHYESYLVFLKDTEDLKLRKAYERIKNKLSLKHQRMNHEAIIQALDTSADDYVLACDLHLIARDASDKFELRYEIEMSKLLSLALKDLEKKKKSKEITSQITESLKRGWVLEHHEAKAIELEDKRRELKIVKLRMENMKEAWKNRMSALQSQARAIDSQRQIRLGGGHEKEED